MNENTFLVILAAASGLFTLAASIFNWNWYFESRRAKFFVNTFGRSGARLFYGALGAFLILVAAAVARL